MKYLFDVNALIALGVIEHEFHRRVEKWAFSQHSSSTFLTCSITELGFVRILSQPAIAGLSVNDAKSLLLRLKSQTSLPLSFIPDTEDISQLPGWVKSSARTTDAHLAQLAKAHGAVLATFDAKIPGAYVIP
jgi:uncharacterized protein